MRRRFGRPLAEAALVVGRCRSGEVDVLRIARDPQEYPGRTPGLHRVLAAGTIPWEPGAALGEPLERLLRWRASEPLFLAVPTPALAGRAVPFRRSLDAQASEPSDLRELALEARWYAREQVRDEAAQFFGCSLEDLDVLSEQLGPWEFRKDEKALETVCTVLVRGPDPGEDLLNHGLWPLSAPPDVPTCVPLLLPVFFSVGFQSDAEPYGLLMCEERRLSLVVCRADALQAVRSAPVGGFLVSDTLTRTLRCSPREAHRILSRADQGALPPETLRALVRSLRPLLPVFRAAVQVLSAGVRPGAFPRRVFTGGVWPSLFQRLFFRSLAFPNCLVQPTAPRVLPRPDTTMEESPSRLAALSSEAPLSLLLQLGDVAIRKFSRVTLTETRGKVRARGAGQLP